MLLPWDHMYIKHIIVSKIYFVIQSKLFKGKKYFFLKG
jgi:hypothetical protein